ncbi:MAG: hypothetical protein WCI79_01925, partial [Candidatus Saccharibacteria bacterium]
MKNNKNGFALPTVLISSIVMLTVLLVAVVSTSAVRASLNSQYYNQLAKSAADAGMVFAKGCLEVNNDIPQWTNNSPLTPATDCTGVSIPGASNFVLDDTDNKLQSTFSVGCVGCTGSNKLTEIVASGTTRLLRPSNGTEWRRYNQTSRLGKYELKMGWKKISSSTNQTCAISSDDKAYCWGTGYLGGVGTAFSNFPGQYQSLVPVAVSDVGGGRIIDISVGATHSCYINTANNAYCWGNNGSGQLGNGDALSADQLRPSIVSSGSLRFKSISAGENYTCAIGTDDKAYCWGSDDSGRLGNGSAIIGNQLVPSAVAGGFKFKSISTGQSHTCAIAADVANDGKAYCWG